MLKNETVGYPLLKKSDSRLAGPTYSTEAYPNWVIVPALLGVFLALLLLWLKL